MTPTPIPPAVLAARKQALAELGCTTTAQAVAKLAEQGLKKKAIMEQLHVSMDTVEFWLHKTKGYEDGVCATCGKAEECRQYVRLCGPYGGLTVLPPVLCEGPLGREPLAQQQAATQRSGRGPNAQDQEVFAPLVYQLRLARR